MAQWKPRDMAAWLHHVHGGDWDPVEIEGPSAIADDLNAAVRRAARGLPLEREPAAFHQLYLALADKGNAVA